MEKKRNEKTPAAVVPKLEELEKRQKRKKRTKKKTKKKKMTKMKKTAERRKKENERRSKIRRIILSLRASRRPGSRVHRLLLEGF